jgi:L-ascorbate metabolism protein UlaG (beta-lactamase superfamily)
MDIRWLGQACFTITDGDTTLLIDPFLTGNPKGAATAEEVDADVIALTHGHPDHLGDTVDIARRTGATVVAIVELAGELTGALGDDHPVLDPNLGGTVRFDWGWIKLVPAWHTAVSPSGTPHVAAGLVIHMGERTIYHLGDTCLFSDLALIAKRGNPIDVALMPIGGHYTMDRWDAIEAVNLVGAKQVIPCHYDTFPPIETDAQAFKAEAERATSSEIVILAPGDTHGL